MTRILKLVALASVVLFCGCMFETWAPFPSSFAMIGPDQFEFIAGGNVNYPANTKSSEKGRLAWLNYYLEQNRVCPFGYEIVERKPEQLRSSAKSGLDEQRYLSLPKTKSGRIDDASRRARGLR
jgi:hypothetical protein